MLKSITPLKLIIVNLISFGIILAGFFGFKCPAQGCPACKLFGQ